MGWGRGAAGWDGCLLFYGCCLTGGWIDEVWDCEKWYCIESVYGFWI